MGRGMDLRVSSPRQLGERLIVKEGRRTKNRAEKTRSKKPNFGGHQTEEGQGYLGVRIWGWTSVVRDKTINTCDLGMSLCACMHTWGWWNSSK